MWRRYSILLCHGFYQRENIYQITLLKIFIPYKIYIFMTRNHYLVMTLGQLNKFVPAILCMLLKIELS